MTEPRTVLHAVGALALVALLLAAPLAHAASAFGFADVEREARALAQKPYKPPGVRISRELRDLNYDQYRSIRYRPERAVWRKEGLPFELMFFHPGFHFVQPVPIYEIAENRVAPFAFMPDLFDYGRSGLDPARVEAQGFAGFRVHFPVNTPRYKDEVLVFLGASYFRAVGKSQIYGLSARGLAVDTGLPSGEEFPQFAAFWIERPAPNAKELTIYALLDSRRVAGAYRFVLRPGTSTQIDVRARLFLREQVTILGIAPLTSMFYFGENQRSVPDGKSAEDFRPEVHDSDGVSIHSGTGEWLWRPLVNPRRLSVSSFQLVNPQGFGLMQRDRDFARYEDLEARYERRPSAWVAPRGKWGAGRLELVTLPTPNEFNDNIVMFWVPDAMPPLREPFDLEYRLSWELEQETRPPQGVVMQTRRGMGPNRGVDGAIGFVIDFDGPPIRRAGKDTTIEAVVTVDGNAELLENVAMRHDISGGVRVALRIRRRDDAKPVEMRAFLKIDGAAVSETWSYLLPPG